MSDYAVTPGRIHLFANPATAVRTGGAGLQHGEVADAAHIREILANLDEPVAQLLRSIQRWCTHQGLDPVPLAARLWA
jgi:hypothetical protein